MKSPEQEKRLEAAKQDQESWPKDWPGNMEWEGDILSLDLAYMLLTYVFNAIYVGDKKVRVTIERDPEKGKFRLKRKTLD